MVYEIRPRIKIDGCCLNWRYPQCAGTGTGARARPGASDMRAIRWRYMVFGAAFPIDRIDGAAPMRGLQSGTLFRSDPIANGKT